MPPGYLIVYGYQTTDIVLVYLLKNYYYNIDYFQFEEMQCRVFILPIIVLCFSLVKYDVNILFDDNKVLHTIFQ